MNTLSTSTKRVALLAIAVAACGLNAFAADAEPHVPPTISASNIAWNLDSSASNLWFVTTKNTNIAEVQQFKKLSGYLSPNGNVKLVIDLASVETQIPLRNERLQSMLFEVLQFPTAQFEGAVNLDTVSKLAVGSGVDMEVAGKLTIHGKTNEAVASLRVVRLQGKRLLVTTRAPILVSAAEYDLAPGIEKLRDIMGLPNIIGNVPVNFSLEFQQ